MKKLIFLFAFSIAVTNIFAQTDPNQIKKEGNDAFNAKNYPVAYAKFSEYLKQTNNQDSATAYYCGIAADEVKKYAEAVTFFDIAIQKKFNTGNAYARKALALDALKKTDEYVATLEEGLKEGETGVFLETAHPAKFLETVESIIGESVEIPAKLQEFMKGEKKSLLMTKEFADFKSYLLLL